MTGVAPSRQHDPIIHLNELPRTDASIIHRGNFMSQPDIYRPKKLLEALFRVMYHDKFDFRDFEKGLLDEYYSKQEHREHDKVRIVIKPNKKFKTYHTFLNLFLFEHLPINERVVFSYRKGFSAYDAVFPHRNGTYFFQSDIKNFFSCIDRDLIKTTIEHGKGHAPIVDVDAHIERILDLVCIEGTLPPGLPASPVISNAVLKAFDDDTEEYCKSLGCTYTRYSDDLIVSGPAREPLEGLRERLSSSLKSMYGLRFELNDSKSKLFKTGGKISILGLSILPNKRISVDSKIRTEVELLLHFYLTDRKKFVERAKGDITKASEKISGYLNYVNSIDALYLDKLRRKYGATTVDMFLHRSFI
jgi:RNA-directed DNA polymerase